MNLTIDSFVLTTGAGDVAMRATMNRYRPSSYQENDASDGFILLFAHGTGFHKEQWEPTITHLFEYDQGNKSATRMIEAWAVDCQSHGEAAALNDDLFVRKPRILEIQDYSEALATLYRSGLLGNIKKGAQKIVLVGHSAGSVAALLATARFGTENGSPFDMVILVESPICSPENLNNHTEMYRIVESTTPARRATWDSREAAHEYFKTRIPWKVWDPRNLELYTKHGLRSLPNPFYPDKKGFGLCCIPAHEADAFALSAVTLEAIQQVVKINDVIPVHAVYGARNDMFSREYQDSFNDPSKGRVLSSTIRIKGAGHLVVQEKPKLLAEGLKGILESGRVRQWNDGPKL